MKATDNMDDMDDMNHDDDSKIDITAIVISYNSEGRIGDAVASHEAALAAFEAEILVVDNASADSSVEEARNALTRGRVIANTENLGYGKAANQGIRTARGRACLILNDDAHIDATSITRLNEVLFSSDDVALVGPRIVDGSCRPMPSARTAFPGPGEEAQRIGDVLRGRNRNAIYPATSAEPMDVAWLVAACVLGKTDVLRKVGGFNPAFFLYSEDIDLCRRLRHRGYRIVTVPNSTCVHAGSVSTGATMGATGSSRRRTDARDLYYRIWNPRPVRSLIHLRRAIGLSNQPERLRHHLPRVLWDGRSLTSLRNPPSLDSDSPDNGKPRSG